MKSSPIFIAALTVLWISIVDVSASATGGQQTVDNPPPKGQRVPPNAPHPDVVAPDSDSDSNMMVLDGLGSPKMKADVALAKQRINERYEREREAILDSYRTDMDTISTRRKEALDEAKDIINEAYEEKFDDLEQRKKAELSDTMSRTDSLKISLKYKLEFNKLAKARREELNTASKDIKEMNKTAEKSRTKQYSDEKYEITKKWRRDLADTTLSKEFQQIVGNPGT